jgi:hypothetical protein
MVVIGPGSLFTSIVPNLLIADISVALAKSPALKIYVCNVAEEPAQTEGYTVLDHLNIIRHYGGADVVDAVVANNNIPNSPTPAGLDFIRVNRPWPDDIVLVEADVIDENYETTTARHDPDKLANAIAEAYRKYRDGRRRLPRVRLNIGMNRNTVTGSGPSPRRRMRFSRRSRASSSPSGMLSPSCSPGPTSSLRTQARKDSKDTPSSRAMADMGFPLSLTRRNALARNSVGYVGLVLGM